MNNTKLRLDFLADVDLNARLNALAKGHGTTKTDIIIRAIETFLESGTESEFTRRTAKRFDILSRELEAVRHDQTKMQSDVTMLLASLVVFIRFCMIMSGPVPKPDKDKQAIGYERLRWHVDEVKRWIAEREKPSPSPETDKASA